MADQSIPLPSGPRFYEVAPRRYWPVATIILFALNFVFFALELYAGGADNTQVLLNFGASFGPYLHRGEYWRLVMPMFLHGGWIHILGNSYALFILGPILERVYGHGRYATIYVAAGIGGALLSMVASNNVSVGASGAIFGIAGAMVLTGYVHRDAIPRRWGRAFGRGIIPFIVLNLAFGLSVHGIDNWGHLGGLATGALLAFIIPPPRHDFSYGEVAEPPSQAWVAFPVAVVVLAVAATANHYRTIQAMDRLLTMDKEQFIEEMQAEVRRILGQVADAVNDAPSGNVISGSEMAVREAMAELRQRVFEKAVQMRIDSTESSFSPSEGRGRETQGKQGTLPPQRVVGQRADQLVAAAVVRRKRGQRLPGGQAGG